MWNRDRQLNTRGSRSDEKGMGKLRAINDKVWPQMSSRQLLEHRSSGGDFSAITHRHNA
jgi:hypothetical protein